MIKNKLEALKQLIGDKAAEEIVANVVTAESTLEKAGIASKEVNETELVTTSKNDENTAAVEDNPDKVYTEAEVEQILTQFYEDLVNTVENDSNSDGESAETSEEDVTAKEYLDALVQLTDGLKAVAIAVKEIRDQQNALTTKVGAMYDEIPAKAKEYMRASQAEGTITQKAFEAPSADPLDNFITSFVTGTR